MGYVFINYASRDRQFASRIVADLNRSGIETWFDAVDLGVGNFLNVLGKAVDEADAMIVVVSKNSIPSEWVKLELNYALSKQLSVVSIAIDDSDADALSPFLKLRQIIDASNRYDLALTALFASLPESVKQGKKISPSTAHAAKGYVFLSYANSDAQFADRLKPFLKERNYAYWDYRDTDRDYQSLLAVELERAIKSARATLCILSPNWRSSEWTLNEYEYSVQIGKPTLLLKMEPFDPILRIAAKTYIDFTQGFDSGAMQLDRELGRYGLI